MILRSSFPEDIVKVEKYIIRFLEFRSEKYTYLRHIPENGKVLDIGCGDCRRLRYRSYFRNDLVNYGIDSRDDVRCGKYLNTFYNLDITREKLPFAEEYFDLVVLSHVVEHLPKDGFLFVMKEIRRVLKEGGYVYIEFPSEKTRHFMTAETLRRFACPVTTLNFYDDKTHISLYTIQELTGILRDEKMSVCGSGDIREPVKKCLSPMLLLAGYMMRDKSIFTGSLWALLNWASFIIARK